MLSLHGGKKKKKFETITRISRLILVPCTELIQPNDITNLHLVLYWYFFFFLQNKSSTLEDNFVFDLVFYPVKLLTYDMDTLVGVIVLLNNLVDRLVYISRHFEWRGYNLLSAMIKGYGF